MPGLVRDPPARPHGRYQTAWAQTPHTKADGLTDATRDERLVQTSLLCGDANDMEYVRLNCPSSERRDAIRTYVDRHTDAWMEDEDICGREGYWYVLHWDKRPYSEGTRAKRTRCFSGIDRGRGIADKLTMIHNKDRVGRMCQ